MDDEKNAKEQLRVLLKDAKEKYAHSIDGMWEALAVAKKRHAVRTIFEVCHYFATVGLLLATAWRVASAIDALRLTACNTTLQALWWVYWWYRPSIPTPGEVEGKFANLQAEIVDLMNECEKYDNFDNTGASARVVEAVKYRLNPKHLRMLASVEKLRKEMESL